MTRTDVFKSWTVERLKMEMIGMGKEVETVDEKVEVGVNETGLEGNTDGLDQDNKDNVEDNKSENGEDTGTDQDKTQEKTFTQEEVDQIIKARLARESREKAEKLADEIIKERQRVAELSEDERKAETLSKEEERLKKLEDDLNYRQRLADTEDELRERKLGVGFAKLLVGEDEESTFENIKTFQQAFEQAVKEESNERLKGKTPKVNANAGQLLTKDEFDKLSYLEKVELKRKDEALYKKLTGDE